MSLSNTIRRVSSDNLFYFSLLLMCVALPTSIFLISISQFAMAIAWLWKGNHKESFNKFLNNRTAVCIGSIFFIHIIGLAYTSNWNYASNDIRIKLPILILPLLIVGFKPLAEKQLHFLIKIFIYATLVSTLVSTFILLGFSNIQVTDVRQISILISHIRLSLMICLGIFLGAYLVIKSEMQMLEKAILSAIIVWFVAFLIISESGTGIIILSSVLCLLFLYFNMQKVNFLYKLLSSIVIISVIIFSIIKVGNMYSDFQFVHQINMNKLEAKTLNGANYDHYTSETATENGYYVGLYQNWNECKQEWNKRSNINADGKDMRGQYIEYTMKRYLTSKGLRKDSVGVSKLTNEDIKNIEKGITNYKFSNAGLAKRINDIFYEYKVFKSNGDADGHSVYMRLVFWKTALNIIKQNPFIGVGEGDINDAFIQQYQKDNVKLEKHYWLRAHNQYLNIAVAFGVVGLIIFLVLMFQILKTNWNFYNIIFMMIILLSFLNEDTLETSTGAVFFTFFVSLFTIGYDFKKLED